MPFENYNDLGLEITPENAGQCFLTVCPIECSNYSCLKILQPCLLFHRVVIFPSVAHYVSFHLLVQYILYCLEIKCENFSSDIWTHLALQIFSSR